MKRCNTPGSKLNAAVAAVVGKDPDPEVQCDGDADGIRGTDSASGVTDDVQPDDVQPTKRRRRQAGSGAGVAGSTSATGASSGSSTKQLDIGKLLEDAKKKLFNSKHTEGGDDQEENHDMEA